MAGYAALFVLGSIVVLGPLDEYLFAATFTAFDIPNQTVPVAIAQLSGRTPQPLYLTVLSHLSGPLFGSALWAGLPWAKLKRL